MHVKLTSCLTNDTRGFGSLHVHIPAHSKVLSRISAASDLEFRGTLRLYANCRSFISHYSAGTCIQSMSPVSIVVRAFNHNDHVCLAERAVDSRFAEQDLSRSVAPL